MFINLVSGKVNGMSQAGNEGLTAKKSDNFDEWYTQVMLKAELADYSPVSGCIVFRPSGYAVWENIQHATDSRFKKSGVQNVYFPLLIPERLLKREAEHVEGFAPEVAWVTQAGGSDLDERLAIRPTSEAIMYEVVSKWIRSWRDLPMRMNQWNNVIRWEFKHPTPFLRTREFLWNEGHSIFASKEEAEAERDQILGIYLEITEEFLALPGYVGKKTDSEKFAGAEASYSIEHLLPDGKAIQGPDFHSDGQRFAKAFEITFLDKNEEKQFAWQNTWAITTREIGVMLAMHGDDRGAVIPPRVAGIQAVIVPILNEKTRGFVLGGASKLREELSKEFRVHIDDRDNLTPGRKFNEWELRGIPLRLELGPRDIEANNFVLVRRDTGAKRSGDLSKAREEVGGELDSIQESLLTRAREHLARNTHMTSSYEEMKRIIKEQGGIVRAPWCGSAECETKIKEETGARILNMPLDQHPTETECVGCGKKARMIANIGRSY